MVNCLSVPKTEWKQTAGQMDGGDCITSLANAAGKITQPLKKETVQRENNLKLSFVEVLEPLQWHNFIETAHERFCLFTDATMEEPLSHQTTVNNHTNNVTHLSINLVQLCSKRRFQLPTRGVSMSMNMNKALHSTRHAE